MQCVQTNQNTPLQQEKLPKRFLALSFFLPVLFMGIGFIIQGIHPFGDRQILVTDFWHQYYPFLRLLHEKLQNGGSLLYTWDSGLGTNWIATAAYYAASPLNLLTAAVPDSLLRDAVTIVLLLKVGFAGLFFAMFLRGTFRRGDFSICLFSLMYALCSYILGYYWNIIWLDTVALLPLVVLGLVYLVRDGRYRLYILSLALSLVTNYYIGMFTCIFSVIAFLCLLVFYVRPRQLAGRIGAMAAASLMGGALAAIVILPTYYALQLTYSVNNVFPSAVEFYHNWRTLLANMISFHAPTAKDGLPNLACGVLALVLAGPFLRSGKIRIREKIAAILVLAFLLISCSCNILNYIWHGFHFPNMLPYRFSFLCSFVLLTLAYRAFVLVLEEQQTIWDSIAMLAAAVAFFLISYSVQENHAVLYTLAIAILYTLVLLLYLRKVLNRRLMYAALSVVLAFEMYENVRMGTETVGSSDYPSYPAQADSVEDMLDEIAAQDDTPFYRTELAAWYTLNDPALYGYHGLSQFSSMANEDVTAWMRALGLPASEAGNRYYYGGGSPVTNMFTGIRYLISRSASLQDSYGWELIGSNDGAYAYRNRFDLPVGFVTDASLAEYMCMPNGNPFDSQNKLFQLATGIDTPLFTKVEVDSVSYTGATATMNGYGSYNYQIDSEADTHRLQYNYRMPRNAVLYGYMNAANCTSISLSRNGGFLKSYSMSTQPYLFPLGQTSGTDEIGVSALLKPDSVSGNVTLYVYALNEDVLEQGYAKLAEGSVTVTDFADTELTCTVDAKTDGLCYFSIPYEAGWQAEVDGEPVEAQAVGNAMLALSMNAGKHTVTLHYCPKGFAVGAALTGGTVLLLLVLAIVERKRKRPFLQPVPERMRSGQGTAAEAASATSDEKETGQTEQENCTT